MRRAWLAGVCLAWAGGAVALPVSPVVLHGSAGFHATGAELQVELLSSSVIIDWESFSIAAGETVSFAAPVGWAALNRVRGAGASSIGGLLQTPVNFGLVNLAGIETAGGSSVAGRDLLLSAAQIADDDFLAQAADFTGFTYQWEGGAGGVSIFGALSGESVFLAGESVVLGSGGSVTASDTLSINTQDTQPGGECTGCAEPIQPAPPPALTVVPLPPSLALFLAGFGALLGLRGRDRGRLRP